MNCIKVPAILEKATTLKDRSIKLIFVTNELDADKCAALFALRQQLGWLIFCSTDVDEIEIPNEPPTEVNQKTPSQRLRAVLFKFWEQTKDPNDKDFEGFYRNKIEGFITHYKSKLDNGENR